MEATKGTPVVLTRSVERFPHFVARAGMSGKVLEFTDGLVCVRMDEHLPGAEEWDNEICWTPEDEYPGSQQDAREAASRDLQITG